MDELNTSFNEKESLHIIHEMINKTKRGLKGNSFYYLLWGWLVFIASSIQFTLITFFPEIKNPSRVWILMPVGLLLTFFYKRRDRKKQKVKTYIGSFLGYFWMGFAITIILICTLNRMQTHQFFATLMCFYGLGLFVSGSVLEFRPLQLGGFWCWICSAIGFNVDNKYILLLLAAAVLGGYIIPGYILKYSKKSEQV